MSRMKPRFLVGAVVLAILCISLVVISFISYSYLSGAHPHNVATFEGRQTIEAAAPDQEDYVEPHEQVATPKADVEELQSEALQGNLFSQAELAKIYSECQNIAAVGMRWNESVKAMAIARGEYGLRAERILEDHAQKCAQLDNGEVIPADSWKEWAALAANNGDLTTSVMLAASSFSASLMPHDEKIVEEVIASGNPEALFELSNLMWRAPAPDSRWETHAGSQAAAQSWAVAACRLGHDCGPDSKVMRQLCTSLGVCRQTNYEQYVIQELLTPRERRAFEQQVSEITTRTYRPNRP